MLATVVIGIGALIIGLFLGIVLGAGMVINRIRDYRDTLGELGSPLDYTIPAHLARSVLGDLLTYLESARYER